MKEKLIIFFKLLSIIFLLLIPIPFGKGITVPFGMLSVFYFVDRVSNLVLNFTDITIVLWVIGLVFIFQKETETVFIGYLLSFVSFLPIIILNDRFNIEIIFCLYLLVSVSVILLSIIKKESFRKE